MTVPQPLARRQTRPDNNIRLTQVLAFDPNRGANG
jgi:hypothetical protein